MATAQFNGIDVIEGSIRIPRIGVWTADVALDTQDPSQVLGDTFNLQFQDEEGNASLSLSGTAARAGLQFNCVTARIAGGAGGMGGLLPPKFYKGVPFRIPLQDLVAAAGETLSATADPGVLGAFLTAWTRSAATAGESLTALLGDSPGGPSWRVLPDGTIWVGPETWPDSSVVSSQLLRDDEYLGRNDLGVEVPTLLPGTVFAGRHVSYVEHIIDQGQTRTIAYFEAGSPAIDRAKAALTAFIQGANPRQLFLGQFAGKIVAQRGDGTVDVVLDDPRLPGVSSVPIRVAFPGLKVTVSPGARVMVGFENGDPANPVAELFGAGTTLEADLVANLLKLGPAPTDAAIKGTTYLGLEAPIWVALNTFLLSLTPGPITAAQVAAAKAVNLLLTPFITPAQQAAFLSQAVELT